jgi:hypothetical protein
LHRSIPMGAIISGGRIRPSPLRESILNIVARRPANSQARTPALRPTEIITPHSHRAHCENAGFSAHYGMKARGFIWVLLGFACFFFGGCVSAPQAAKSNPYFARVKGVRGDVLWAHRGGNWETLPKGARLYEGDQVRASLNSSVDLDFGKYGGKMEVPPSSEIAIDEFGASAQTPGETRVVVRARQGHVTGDTLDLPSSTKFYIRTDTGDVEVK